jgi:hypothetical protein
MRIIRTHTTSLIPIFIVLKDVVCIVTTVIYWVKPTLRCRGMRFSISKVMIAIWKLF